MGLLAEIEIAAVNSSASIVDLLRQCKVLAARLKHKDFAEWVDFELNGYPEPSRVPEYRTLNLNSPVGHFAGPLGSGIKNSPIPVSLLPDELRESLTLYKLTQPIAEVEALANSKKGSLQHVWSGDIIAYLQHKLDIYQHMHLTYAFSNISTAQLKGIVDTVRTKVLDYVLAIQAENPDADQSRPGDPAPISPKVLQQTFNMTIVGGQANVGGLGEQSISGSNTANFDSPQNGGISDQVIIQLLGQLQNAVGKLNSAEKEEAKGALAMVEKQLVSKKPNLERVKSYLDIAGSLVKLAPLAEKLFHYLQQVYK